MWFCYGVFSSEKAGYPPTTLTAKKMVIHPPQSQPKGWLSTHHTYSQKAGYPPTTVKAKKPFQLPLNINKQWSKGDAIPQGIVQILLLILNTGIWNVRHEALCFVTISARPSYC
jgi:hypothetical protein